MFLKTDNFSDFSGIKIRLTVFLCIFIPNNNLMLVTGKKKNLLKTLPITELNNCRKNFYNDFNPD